MSMYRKEWPCCGDVTETDAWEPESCPFCTATDHPAPASTGRENAEQSECDAALRAAPAVFDLPPLPQPWRKYYERPHGPQVLLYYTAEDMETHGKACAKAASRFRAEGGNTKPDSSPAPATGGESLDPHKCTPMDVDNQKGANLAIKAGGELDVEAERREFVGFLTQAGVFVKPTDCAREQASIYGWRDVFAAPSNNSPVGAKEQE